MITILLLFVCSNVLAQRPQSGGWFSAQLPVSFNPKWQWHNDAGYRTLGTSTAALQYLYRTGVRYTMTENWNTAAGVAFFFTRTSFQKTNHEFGKEFRFWEEVNYKIEINNRLQLISRLRTEQRFFSATQQKDAYTAYRMRLRTQAQQQLTTKWSLLLADEYMQQYAHHKFLFDQNRLIVSAVYQINSSAQLQGGYMWLLWPDAPQHICTVTLQKNILLNGN